MSAASAPSLASPIETSRPTLFRSFLQGGFECSTHCYPDGRRVDLLESSRHAVTAESDYRRLQEFGVFTVRDGLRWHRLETAPGKYDWSSFRPMLKAARSTGMQVIWDLCHYGYPDGLDIFSSAFLTRFAAFCREAAKLICGETDEVPFFCPVNEISFWAWAGGDAAYLNPCCTGKADPLKRQLARASIAGINEIWRIEPQARIVHADPVIHITAAEDRPWDSIHAARHREGMFQAWDMLSGRTAPELGGDPRYLDIVGLNYYWNNQWIHDGPSLDIGHPCYIPFRLFLIEVYRRYGRPLFVAETGIEAERRPAWLRYMADEVEAAMAAGVPVEGLCWYPIMDHPGWGDDRHCPNGLLDYADSTGYRPSYAPLSEEWQRQRARFAAFLDPSSAGPAEGGQPPFIVLCTDSEEPSGMGEQMLTLGESLLSQYRILLACPSTPHSAGFLDRAREAGLDAEVLPDPPGLENWLRRLQPDLVHNHAGIGWEGQQLVAAAHAAGVPVIRTEHLPYVITDHDQRLEHARLLSQVALLVCVSEGARQTFAANDVQPEKIRVVQNGVQDVGVAPNREEVRRELGIDAQAPLLLTVGRFTPQKNYARLLEAVRLVLDRLPRARFVWVGDGPDRPAIEALIREEQLEQAIRLIRHSHNVPRLMAAADLLIAPSRFEGLPLVVLEAMACSLPVIGTHVCGLEEAVQDGRTGLLVADDNAGELASAIDCALSHPVIVDAWREAARAAFEAHWRADRMAAEMSELYQEVLILSRQQRQHA